MPKIQRNHNTTPQNTAAFPPVNQPEGAPQTTQQPPRQPEQSTTTVLPKQQGRAEKAPEAAKPDKPAAPVIGEPTGFYDQDHDADFADRQAAKDHGKAPKTKKQKRGDLLYTLAIAVCALIFVISGGLLVKRYFDDRRVEGEFASLAAQIDTSAAANTEPSAEGTPGNTAKFAALQQLNPDFFGWVSIEDTNLDFPVMFAPANKDFYLRHDFDGEYSIYGVPYLDEKTTVGSGIESQNLIIYGHNMKTGTIFGCLTGYKNADYYAAHPQITFDTIYGDATYEVFAAFAIDVVQDPSFAYNEYVNMDEAAFDAYLSQVIGRSDVDTGIIPQYGDRLLTLSTCEYSSDNGRYVVVARCAAP